jgi:hypothetical protein
LFIAVFREQAVAQQLHVHAGARAQHTQRELGRTHFERENQHAHRFAAVRHRSRFGHPSPAVLARYAEAGVPVVSSARCGAWRLASEGPSMACMRSERRRYWHHPGP